MVKRLSILFLNAILVINLIFTSFFSIPVYAENKPKTLWDNLNFYPHYILDSCMWFRGWVDGNGTHLLDIFKENARTLDEWHESESWEDFCRGITIDESKDEEGKTVYNFPANYVSIINATVNQLKEEYDAAKPYTYIRSFAPSDIRGDLFGNMKEFEMYKGLVEQYTTGDYETCLVYSNVQQTSAGANYWFIYCVPLKATENAFVMTNNLSSQRVYGYCNWYKIYGSNDKVDLYIQRGDGAQNKSGHTRDLAYWHTIDVGESETITNMMNDQIIPYQYERCINNVWSSSYETIDRTLDRTFLFSSSHNTYKAYRSIQDLKNVDSGTYSPGYYIIDNDKFNTAPNGPVSISQDEIDNSIHYGDIDNSVHQYINENNYYYSGISEETLQAIIQMIINQFKNQPTPVNPTPTNPTPSDPIYIGGGGGISSNIIIHNNNNNYWTIGGSASDNSVSGNGWNLGGFFGGASSFLHAFVEGLLNLIGTLLGQLESLMTLISEFIPRIVEAIPSAMTELMTAVFPFLPEEVGLAISLSVVLLLVSVVIKMFRG